MLRERQVNIDIEKKILTALIVSDKFCQEILPMMRLEYFHSDYSKRIAKWVAQYHAKYRQAPGVHIQDIYEVERESLREDGEREMIASFLQGMSSEYEQGTPLNVPYLVDRSVALFRERALHNTSEGIKAYLGAGRVEDAEKVLQDYRKVAKSITQWVNPLDAQFAAKVFENKLQDVEDDRTDFLFRFPGALGKLLGHFERGWLISFLAPMKRGKTFFLQELTFQALLARLNVVFISLEMSDDGMSVRFYKRVTGLSQMQGDILYPVFDCERNQKGSCGRRERSNRVAILRQDGARMSYQQAAAAGYRTCVWCRENDPHNVKGFLPTSWFEPLHRDKMSYNRVVSQLNGLTTSFGDRLRLKSYPAYSANLSTVLHDLIQLEFTENFIPDVIALDYADILAPEDTRLEGRERIDQTWKMLKRIASERHCLVATASQANRQSMDRRDVRNIDVAEDIRKLAHVDAMFTLNQTPWEKRNGIIRVGTIAHRWNDFDANRQVMVLQNLSQGQVVLDSEIMRYEVTSQETAEGATT